MLEQLGDLLRLSLEHADEQEIPLERELTFVDRYIQLQLVRFADRLEVERATWTPEVTAARRADVPAAAARRERDPPRRVEADRAAGCIELTAWRSGDRLRLRVRDNGPGLPPGWILDRNVGIGLGNTRARLEQLYGEGQLHLRRRPRPASGGTSVDITIPFRVA